MPYACIMAIDQIVYRIYKMNVSYYSCLSETHTNMTVISRRGEWSTKNNVSQVNFPRILKSSIIF